MSTPLYYAGFDVVHRDINGYTTPLVGESIKVRIVGGADYPESPLTTGANGHIPPGSVSGTSGSEEIEFYSGTKTGILRQMSAAVAGKVYSRQATLILNDAFVTTKDAVMADIYVRDNTSPGIPLQFLGTQPAGTTVIYPFESAFLKNIDVIAVGLTEKFEPSNLFRSDAPFDSIAPPSTRPADQIETDVTGIISGTIGNFFYHKSGNVLGEYTPTNARAALFPDGANLVLGTTTGTKIGTATGQKLGFYGAAPVAQQTITGTTAQQQIDSIVDALGTVGLVVDGR
jgi:hypothetical protein